MVSVLRWVGTAVSAVAVPLLAASPALADVTPPVSVDADHHVNFGGGINAANNWNFTAASVCFQELAVVPVGGAWNGVQTNHCVNGNVLDHSGQ
ncbi:hypothetical protein [Actinokineospora bangkokensis]|uniref:Secreted protein n=1 Tax=Actinokineospora bangkokensis TaxID=1193682 RepID=A0A1Q9LME0_9PSEU|nr:hypothetical protein [Actinokineospora bangkokensis]OLR93206.1 hypothetical protein BJP25_17075 [Actinokineospora bangkokensis]